MPLVIKKGTLINCRADTGNDDAITSLVIPEGVTAISASALHNCRNMTEITLPATLTNIEFGAFWKCPALETINVPPDFTALTYDDLSRTKWYENQTGEFVMLGTVLLRYRGYENAVAVPNGITSIGKEAFSLSDQTLEKVILPDSVKQICDNAFQGCTALEEVVFPAGLKTIGGYAFSYCIRLAHIDLPDGLQTIGANAFENTALKSITLPEGLEDVPPGAFGECIALEEIILPESIRTISGSAFRDCENLVRIDLPPHLERIYDSAFHSCGHLEQVSLPDSLTEIDGHAFAFCTALKSVTLPGSLKILGRHCFDRCNNLKEILVAGDNKKYCSIDGAVYSRDGTLLVMVPTGKTELTLSGNLTKITSYIITPHHKLEVLRLYPDDAAICRIYGRVRDVEDEIVEALGMIRTGKYTTQVNSVVKYPFIIQKYLREPDEATAAYLRHCMPRIMSDAIRAGDVVGISALARTGEFFTKSGIERYIRQALAEKQQQIWAILADYKNRHFGFESKNDLL